jgi:hypothetical protein
MKILLYNPDNGVTRNFMPHLWMFLLQSLTPPRTRSSSSTATPAPWTRRSSSPSHAATASASADVNKNFSKPGEYRAVLERLAARNIYAITSFIFGMDNDEVGVAERTVREIESWPPGLPVFGQLTPFPATPLYERLERAGRLARPKHWLEFAPFVMAHAPLKMTIEEARLETRRAWEASYSPGRNAEAVRAIAGAPFQYRAGHLIARFFFRGIYFPQMSRAAWMKLFFDNRATLWGLIREGTSKWRRAARRKKMAPAPEVETADVVGYD